MVNINKIPSSFYICGKQWEGRPMVEALSVMQKKSQTREWIIFYNKKNYYWDILSTYETKSGNEGFILRREITKEENDEIKKGLSKIVNNVLININYVQGKVHPKEKRG